MIPLAPAAIALGLTALTATVTPGPATDPVPKALRITTYDDQIRRAVDLFWGEYAVPSAWKAQLFQESRLSAAAVSPVGARGLAQFMPGTWADVTRELGHSGRSPHEDLSIELGAYYMAKLARMWSARRPIEDRWDLARASYNAGAGHILRAQRLCGGRALYAEIIACLPQVTGRHAQETTTYVTRIRRWRAAIEREGLL